MNFYARLRVATTGKSTLLKTAQARLYHSLHAAALCAETQFTRSSFLLSSHFTVPKDGAIAYFLRKH